MGNCVISQVELLDGRFFFNLKVASRLNKLPLIFFLEKTKDKLLTRFGFVRRWAGWEGFCTQSQPLLSLARRRGFWKGTDYFGSDETIRTIMTKKLLKTVRTIYYDVNDQNFVDDWSPVFRGVTIKEIGLHPSGVLRVLNKPAQSPSLASRHQHQIEWIKASPFLFQVINRMMAYHRSKSWCSLILCWTRSQSLQEWKHWNSNFFICIFVSSVFHPPPGTILDQYLYQRWLFCLSLFCMVSRGDKCIS